MSKVLIDQEAVEQVIEKVEATIRHFNIERIGESTYKDASTRCELHEAVNKLRAALEQPGVHRLIYPGGGKELSEKLWHLTFNCVTSHTGNVVHTNKLPMQEMRAFIEHLCVLVDSPPPPQPAQQPPYVPMLTDEEIEREWQFMHGEDGSRPTHHDFANAIEQLVRQKYGLVVAAPQPAHPGGYTA